MANTDIVKQTSGGALTETLKDVGGAKFAEPVYLADGTSLSDVLPNPTAPAVGAYLIGWDTVEWVRVPVNSAAQGSILRNALFSGDGAQILGLSATVDARVGTGTNIPVLPFVYQFNGSTWDRQRTANIFKTLAAVAVTAGTPVAAWTPAAAKKFRLMGYALSLSVAGGVVLKDAASELIRTPLMLAGDGHESPPLGNGMLSAAANNVLNIDVTATGTVSGYVFGTEE